MDPITTDEDVDAVLKLALRKQGQGDLALRDRLTAAADELGITPEELRLAEKEYAKEKAERAEFLEFRGKQLRDFREHFFTYVVINTLLVGLNLLTSGRVSWAIWPILGWGIGIAFHAWSSLNTGSQSFQDEFRAFRRRRTKKERRDRDDDDDD